MESTSAVPPSPVESVVSTNVTHTVSDNAVAQSRYNPYQEKTLFLKGKFDRKTAMKVAHNLQAFECPYFPVDVVPPDEHADFLTLLQRRFPAYVVGTEVALFTREDVLLDSQASVNVFSNKDLLHDVSVAKRTIALKGVEQGTRGVSIQTIIIALYSV